MLVKLQLAKQVPERLKAVTFVWLNPDVVQAVTPQVRGEIGTHGYDTGAYIVEGVCQVYLRSTANSTGGSHLVVGDPDEVAAKLNGRGTDPGTRTALLQEQLEHQKRLVEIDEAREKMG